MIVDETRAKVALKKKINVLLRRKEILEAPNKPVRKSRLRWAKNMMKMIERTSIIIEIHQKDNYHVNLTVLAPHKGSFSMYCVQLDAKKQI